MNEPGELIRARTERMVAGGAALGRLPDGQRALVSGALPGEDVVAIVTRQQRGLVHGLATEIIDAAPERVAPPCPMVAAGCGGCDWQHIAEPAQPAYKRDIVVDALERIGHLDASAVEATIALAPRDYRTTIRGIGTDDGVLGLRRTRSHDAVPIAGCLVAHPRLRALIDATQFSPGRDVTLRAGTSGDRDTDTNVGSDGETVHMRVDDVDFEVPVRSFFQPHVDGPAALTALAREMLAGVAPEARRLADLYAGVGVFASTVPGASVVAVERVRYAARAAVRNLRRHRGDRATVVTKAVERADIGPADVVVADPSRAGLGKLGAAAVAHTGAEAVALVSCDPASFARDARLLVDRGYELDRVVPVDQFGHTSHIEVVGGFTRVRRTASRARRPR